MTYKLSWLTPGEVIRVVLADITTDHDMQQLDLALNTMLNSTSQRVHILMDARILKANPSAQATMKMSYYNNPRLGQVAVTGCDTNPFLAFLSTVISHVMAIRINVFATPEEAHDYLASIEYF